MKCPCGSVYLGYGDNSGCAQYRETSACPRQRYIEVAPVIECRIIKDYRVVELQSFDEVRRPNHTPWPVTASTPRQLADRPCRFADGRRVPTFAHTGCL